MSDFDEEAERERLREQYEREQQKREATEHMSELLLKGATMTDAHCDECGDPIFRYDGQTFCPTCQREVDFDAEGGNATDSPATSSGEASPGESAEGRDDRDLESAATSDTTDSTGNEASTSPAAVDEREGAVTQSGPADDDPAIATERVEIPAVDPESGRDPSRSGSGIAGDLAEARDSLQRTLLSFARQAESIDDPRRARDALEAAHEAADALAAIDRIR
ncbi:Sjogren's syndrome/scleroderma autoantigen 1 family protein [Halorhabdus amylolytica]|uniref:Sjogren's syndrome/scleroderma autoantigen 1 family protein n=1 Tax=Halorhabdus amylolytica TaxID=2559573 RepID=UPI0010AA1D7D|nr:Sjogren's syndrome/scleroderma autoantigen 1 family protein [Halorhabdus amylolytica]